jgi:hypothetical protein
VRECVEAGPFTRVRWLLHTADAQGLYARFGFVRPDEGTMERSPPPREPGRGGA